MQTLNNKMYMKTFSFSIIIDFLWCWLSLYPHRFELVLGSYLILLTSIGVNIKTFQKSNNLFNFGYCKRLY
jgi:hypothetical protein